jgi:sugar-specific transcriptional regulator TrmB
MGTEKVRKALKNIGLTEKEAELYIYLAKHYALRSGEIAKGIRTHRVEIYRMLKSMQTKGVIEATLESPRRFIAVPLEMVLDSFIKAKRQETILMENTKQSVLNEWKNISRIQPEPSLEKFVVVEGNKKIYSRLLTMIKETKTQLLVVATVSDLMRADQFGVLDAAFNHPLRDRVKFRFLTDLSDLNLDTMKAFFKRISKTGIDFKGRNPNLGLKLSPRMAMRDKEELLFFIRPATEMTATGKDDVCLWTSCKALVQSFSAVFEDLWVNSLGINEKIEEIESGRGTPTAHVISDASTALITYDQVVSTAKEEILIMTSSGGLVEFWKRIALLKELAGRGVSVKIMAPITKENWRAMQELSNCCSVRHVSTMYFETTVIDGKCLFQFGNQPSEEKERTLPYLGNAFYTYGREYVEEAKRILNEVWKKALVPSATTLDYILMPSAATVSPLSESKQTASQRASPYDKLILGLKENREVITEKYILNKLINGKNYPVKNWPKDILCFYGSTGHAVIHPPKSFDLPDIMIWIMHLNKQSSFGAEDLLTAFLWLKTENGYSYVPVASLTDNPKTVAFRKAQFAGTPASNNVQVVKKEEFQVRIHGKSFFAGWTVPIPLIPDNRILPPSCLLLEGYSKIKTGLSEFRFPSGIKAIAEHNGFDAFVTYFHPASKYSGPGTDGRIHRDIVTTFYPP